MSAVLQIHTDPEAMTITVGAEIFERPHLDRFPESYFGIKEQICGASPSGDWKSAHKFYCEQLGPKFNRRFQAANYWLWLGARMSRKTANLLNHDGRRWREYDNLLVFRANLVLPYIQEAERDGLHHLVPMIVAFQAHPSVIRKQVGRGAWRRIAANSITRNALLMRATRRAERFGGYTAEEFVPLLLGLRSGVLPEVSRPYDILAARLSPRIGRQAYRETANLINDTKLMLGFTFNPAWSYDRIKREHDEAVKAVNARRYSDEPFCDPWSSEANGYRADLLTSPLEIASEGSQQHHCVAAYAEIAKKDRYAVFRITGRERATIGLIRQRDRFILHQVYAACNGPVSSECQAFAAAIALEYSLYQKQSAGGDRSVAA